MKTVSYLFLTGLLVACNTHPNYKNPVTIKGKDVPLYDSQPAPNRNASANVIAIVQEGDTLELLDIRSRPTDTLCRVARDAQRTPLKGQYTSAYIERKFLTIPLVTLKKTIDLNNLPDAPLPPTDLSQQE
jgi:hypothetical protein